MTSSLTTAVGAMRSHQAWLDVIGNNLANSNTTGFKSSRALFSDLLSVTVRPSSGPGSSLGGTNPLQRGIGTQLSSVDRRLEQGALTSTGRTFDLALQGRGYFALSDGNGTVYSRVGTFGLDGAGNMVDLRSGQRVLDSGGAPFQIDVNGVQPPFATTQIGFSGNLPGVVTGPASEELASSSPLMEGTVAVLTGANSGPFTIPSGETWTLEIIANGGAPQEVAIQGTGAAMTAQDMTDAINLQSDDLVASVAGGQVVLTSDRSGTGATIQISPGSSGQDLQTLLGLGSFIQGTETPAATTTDLNQLTLNIGDYAAGDRIQIAGTDADGSAVLGTFTYGTDGTTVADLVSFIDAQFAGSTASFDAATGQIRVISDTTGEAELSLAVSDGTNQVGGSAWSEAFFAVTAEGTGPDTVTTSVEVFDSSGGAHILTLNYERQEDLTWTLRASLPPSEGAVLQDEITGITFNEDGSILTPTSGSLQVQFGTLAAQTLNVDLGTSGAFSGLTQFGNPADVVADFQDGFGAGELAAMQVREDGIIEGFYTNGQTQFLGSFGIATFVNDSGLEDIGDSYLRSTVNSGTRILGNGGASGAGNVIGGSLEASNVDTAVEFVNLIQAQRGFQANARVITVQDELLNEIVNVI